MESVRVYRSVNAVDRFFGLEFADVVALLLVFFLAFMFNREGLFSNGLVLVCTYAGLRALKRNKPDGYVKDLARYVLASRFKAGVAFTAAEDGDRRTA